MELLREGTRPCRHLSIGHICMLMDQPGWITLLQTEGRMIESSGPSQVIVSFLHGWTKVVDVYEGLLEKFLHSLPFPTEYD